MIYHAYFRTPTAARLAAVSLRPYFTVSQPKQVPAVQARSIEITVKTKSPAFPDAAAKARDLSRILQVVNALDGLVSDAAQPLEAS